MSLIKYQIHQPVIKFRHRLRKNVWNISINIEESITYQGSLDEMQNYQNQYGTSNFKISLYRRKIYQRIDIEKIRSRFYQVRPVFLHPGVSFPEKHMTPKKIGEALKGPQRNSGKNIYLYNIKRTEYQPHFGYHTDQIPP